MRRLQILAVLIGHRWLISVPVALALVGLASSIFLPSIGLAQPNRMPPGISTPGALGAPVARPRFIPMQPPGLWPAPGMVVVPPPRYQDSPRPVVREQRHRPVVVPQKRPRLPEPKKKAKSKFDGAQCPQVCEGEKEVDCVTVAVGYVMVRKKKSMPDGTTQEYDEPEPIYKSECKKVPDCREVCPKNPKIDLVCPQVCEGTKDVDCGTVLIGYSKVRRVKTLPDGKEEEYFEDQPIYETACKKVPDCREVCRRKKPKIGGEPQCSEDCSATKDVDCKIVLVGYTKVSRTRTLPDGSKEEYFEDQPVYKNECKKVPDCKKVCI